MTSEFPKDTIGQPPSGGMVERVKRLLMSPRSEWEAIDREPMSAMGIFTSWAVPLAAIGPVAGLIGGQIFGTNLWFVHFRPSLTSSIGTAVLTYIAALVGVWVLALVIEALAPNFGSVKNRDQAMKVAAFSYTAAWIASVLNIMPALAAIGMLLALYSFYLLWVGLPIVMKTPADKVTGYVVVSVVVAIIVQIIISAIAGSIAATLFVTSPLGQAANGTLTIGDTKIDTGKVNAAAAKMQAAAEAMANSANGKAGDGATVKAVDPNQLQAMLPASIGGWTRTSIESQGGGAAGFNGARAEAHYTSGDQSFDLSVADMGALGNLATLGGALNATSNRQTETGYEKTEVKDGGMVSEKWDNQDKSGSYSMMVASRFLVEAEGDAPDIAILKSAVGSINPGQLAALTK